MFKLTKMLKIQCLLSKIKIDLLYNSCSQKINIGKNKLNKLMKFLLKYSIITWYSVNTSKKYKLCISYDRKLIK